MLKLLGILINLLIPNFINKIQTPAGEAETYLIFLHCGNKKVYLEFWIKIARKMQFC